MIRMSAAVVVALAVQLAAAPIPKSLRKSRIPVMKGTTWRADETVVSLGINRYEFLEDGTLTCTCEMPYSQITGEWTQDGDKFRYSVNNKYVEYTATFAEDGTITIKALNVTGTAWDTKLTREP